MSMDDWKRLAERELRGRAIEDLTWQTPEGIEVKPLYSAEDLEGLGLTVDICHMHTIKPLDRETLELMADQGGYVDVEEDAILLYQNR